MRSLLALGLVASLAACATPPRPAPAPPPAPPPVASLPPAPEAPVFAQQGSASWYGQNHQGLPTASGEPFDMNAMTAAHRQLPFGTVVRVTDVKTGRMVKVRINDRGPHAKGRIIDLSESAARALGVAGKGTLRVRIEQFAADQPAGS
ncbi:MAG TPA: septal ring lytic transglycosylase RlpA family protein [Alphaproteobacteria bacterium]